jgi:small subunit ribosomal protein S16
MVVIRLARFGKKHSPKYRLTVADHRRWLNGKFLEVVGHYDPAAKKFDFDAEKVQGWISKGAQPSERVVSLLRKASFAGLPKAQALPRTSASTKKAAKAKAAKAAAAPAKA